jgi:hypothetical protein
MSEEPWPNTKMVFEGVVPSELVSQDPDLFEDDDTDFAMGE